MLIAPSADSAALERTSLATRKVPGEELLVSVDGQVANRAGADGGAPRPTLVVEHLTKVWSGASCETSVE
jgi:hypothetical protein